MRANVAAALGCALLVWACAKANDSDLISRGQPAPGEGGRSGASGGGRAGSSANAGTSSGSGASAGKGGGGKGNAGGAGTSGKAGASGANASGGADAQGGTQARAGSGGTSNGAGNGQGGGAGEGGESGIDPDVLERADVVLRYQVAAATASSKAVDMRLFLENKTNDTLELEHVTIRYWMSAEPAIRMITSYYAAPVPDPDATNVRLRYVADENDDDREDGHIEATFAAGTIAGPTALSQLNATEIQIKADAEDPGHFEQENDYSFDASKLGNAPPAPHDKITVYLAGKLIWGCEPSGACPSTGEGGAGGEAGYGGEAGEAGAGGAAGSSGAGGAGGSGGAGGVAGSGGSGAASGSGQGGGAASAGEGGQGGEPANAGQAGA